MRVLDTDPLLRRLERSALGFTVVAAAVALIVRRGRPDVAMGVLGGGMLVGASYWAIKSGIDGLLRLVAPARESWADSPREGGPSPGDESPGEPRGAPGRGALVLRLVGRYALLGLLAYVMIARLRLHPIGLLIGVSSPVVAASLEAARTMAGARKGRGA